MKGTKNQEYTFIQESAPPSIQEQIVAHLGTTGQCPTPNPNVFEALSIHETITTSTDVLDLEKSLPMHSHTFLEIIYYTSGNNVGCLIGSHRYVLQQGDIVIIPPGVWHCTLRSSRSTVPCTRVLITPKMSLFRGLGNADMEKIANNLKQPYVLRTADTPLEELGKIFILCNQESSTKAPYWREMLNGLVQVLFAQILRTSQTTAFPTIKAQNDGIIERSLSYVDEHLTDKITLSETAQRLFTSERTITREFQKNLGISFYHYVTLRRLELSKELIHDAMPLADISEAVGFSDYPTFYRAFRKYFSCSPRQMRQEINARKSSGNH